MKVSQEVLNEITDTAKENIEELLCELGLPDSFFSTGGEVRCACPVHENSDNPNAFCFYRNSGKWRCYSHRCHEDGDTVFDLVTAIKGISFNDAVNYLANLYDIKVEEEDPNAIRPRFGDIKLAKHIKENIGFRENHSFKPMPLNKVLAALRPDTFFTRYGFTTETLNRFHVGYCSTRGKPMYRRAFACVLDERGENVIGFTGRIDIPDSCPYCGTFHDNAVPCHTDGGPKPFPKWKHYGFYSESVLYNQCYARPSIERTGVALVVESPKNVWWAYQHGLENVVAVLGLQFQIYHIRQLLNMGVTDLIWGLDNDDAGQSLIRKLDEKASFYFKTHTISHLLDPGKDLAETSSERMINTIIPFVNQYNKN